MKLWVLWRKPHQPLSAGSCVVSFLRPTEEEEIAALSGVELIRGRTKVSAVKPQALQIYRELVARIGQTKLPRGQTLRQQMARRGAASRWWFHRLAVRDSESQPHFGWIVQTLVVQAAVADLAATSMVLVGAPPGVAEILRELGPVTSHAGARPVLDWKSAGLALGSRLLYGCRQLRYRWLIGRCLPRHQRRFNVILSNFWDWGLKWNQESGGLSDRYFKQLPQLLAKDPRVTLGYFAWFDPYYETDQQHRPLWKIIAPLIGRHDVILLQGQLGYWDIVRATMDFSTWSACRAARRELVKQKSLVSGGLDWQPLFGPALVYNCLGAEIPNFELVGTATENAARRHRPRLALTFLEHFPYARAHYDGMRRAGIGAANWAMQHAGMCHEKTFYYLHPRVEFAGEPDGCRVPVPDLVFAMGRLGTGIFRECGYREDQVSMVGSARYDHIRFLAGYVPEQRLAEGTDLHILLACTLEVETEMSLVEAASLATRGLSGVSLRLRNHPSNRVDAHPDFAPHRGAMEVSGGTLEADLAWAHVVLFTYSTVAEEALLAGKSVWQWLPLRFNGSALAEALAIPTFDSVPRLREGLVATLGQTGRLTVSAADRRAAAEALFAPADGGAARRIADQAIDWLDRGEPAADIDP